MSAVETIDSEVRELIRRRGLDPWRDPGQIGGLVDEVLADYEDRALSSALPPVGDPRSTARSVLDQVAGFGPLQGYLDDPEIEEIWINEPGKVFIARHGRSELTTTVLGGGQIADLVERMLRTSGRRLDLSTPFVDALLPDGSRLHVVSPDISHLRRRTRVLVGEVRAVTKCANAARSDVADTEAHCQPSNPQSLPGRVATYRRMPQYAADLDVSRIIVSPSTAS